MAASESKLISGMAFALYTPWAVPIEMARESHPDCSANAFASAAVVYSVSVSFSSKLLATCPISASTVTPRA